MQEPNKFGENDQIKSKEGQSKRNNKYNNLAPLVL